jgi:hypothetical protein
VRLASTAGPQPRLAIAAATRPSNIRGHIQLELERFDPLSGWQFVTTVEHAASAGATTFTLRPLIGGWRIRVLYGGTLSASPSVSAWIPFTLEANPGRVGHAGACRPNSRSTFTVGALLLTCGAALGDQSKPSGPAPKTPSAQLRNLASTVRALTTLKEPFKSRLLDSLDAAIQAVDDGNTDAAHAQLDDFLATLQSAPVATQLTADQRRQLTAAVKRVEAQIG